MSKSYLPFIKYWSNPGDNQNIKVEDITELENCKKELEELKKELEKYKGIDPEKQKECEEKMKKFCGPLVKKIKEIQYYINNKMEKMEKNLKIENEIDKKIVGENVLFNNLVNKWNKLTDELNKKNCENPKEAIRKYEDLLNFSCSINLYIFKYHEGKDIPNTYIEEKSDDPDTGIIHTEKNESGEKLVYKPIKPDASRVIGGFIGGCVFLKSQLTFILVVVILLLLLLIYYLHDAKTRETEYQYPYQSNIL